MSNSLFESLRFRVHVRNLLYDYVKKHCTVDYVTFTEALVSEFFEDVQLVPLTDSYSLTLPVDPLDALEKIYTKFPSYVPEDHDAMQVSQGSVAFVKEAFKSSTGKCKTERVVMSGSYGSAPPREPFYPALTRRARQSIKKLGSRGVQQHCKLKDLLEEHKLAVLEVEKVEEPKGDLEDTLNVKIAIEPGEQAAVKSLLRSTLDTLRTDEPYTNGHLDSSSLCSQFPEEPSYTPPEDVFMPIFPRRRLIGISAPATGVELADFKSLVENASAPFEPVDVTNYDEDLPCQNLVLVGGWRAIKSSPPSTPSSMASGNDELDELDDIQFPSSPSTTPPLVQELENSKMDQILIPRSRRIGGKSGITPHILRGKTLNTFLAPLLSQPRTEREEGPRAERVPSPTPSSLIGQPPSTLDIDHDIGTEANHFLDFDVGIEVQKVCEGYDLEPDFFLDEMIDDKAALLMEVPILPEPIEYPKDFYVPKSLSDLVIPPPAKGGQPQSNVDLSLFRFVKIVKGCQSLSLQLSWVPFTIDKQPPSMFEILDVVDLFPQEATDYKQALGLLESVAEGPSSSGPVADVSVRRGLEAGPGDLIYEVPTEEFWIMPNKKERTRLGKPDGSTSVNKQGDSRGGNSDLDIPTNGSLTKLQACLATTDAKNVEAGGHSDPSDVNVDIDRPLKKPRLSVQDQLLLKIGSPADFTDCRPGTDKECKPAAADDALVLSGNGDMTWSPYSTTFSQDNALNYKRDLVQEYASDTSTDRTGQFEPPTYTQPLDYVDSIMEPLQDTGDDVNTSRSSGRQSSGVLAGFDPSSKPELSRHSLGSFAFAQLRARKVSVPHIEPAPVQNLVTSPGTVEPIDLRRGPPPEVCDANTIYLEESIIPQSIHKYMACLELIQKQALVRVLCSRDCAIELVDRRDLAGVDLILDTDTAVIFVNLFSLAVRCEACVDKIAKGSWKFDRLLIIFEAYGELSAKKTKHRHPSLPRTVCRSSEPHAYTPPIVKALKKLKRDLCIAEACGTKRTATIVQYGFADTVEEAALFTRLYGDWCEANDRTHGAIWGARDWLDADILEDEEDHLASLKGFNHFSASIILYQVSLAEFINMLPEERVSAFGAYILADHIRQCNEDIDARLVAMQTGQDSEVEAA